MTVPCLGNLFIKSDNGLAVIPRGDRRDRGFEGTGFFDASRAHVFQKFWSDLCLLNKVQYRRSLFLVERPAVSIIIIITEYDDIEDVADDVTAQVGICA